MLKTSFSTMFISHLQNNVSSSTMGIFKGYLTGKLKISQKLYEGVLYQA